VDFSADLFLPSRFPSDVAYKHGQSGRSLLQANPVDHFDKRPMTMRDSVRAASGQLNIPLASKEQRNTFAKEAL